MDADLPDGVTHWDGPGLDAWRPWTPSQAAHHLAAADVPWCVVGGWAVDLFIGKRTRDHEDLEIAVLRKDFADIRRALPECAFHVVGDGEVRLLDDQDPPPDKHQNWVLDVAADAWRMDVMLEPGDCTTWVFRKDETVCAPRPFMVGRTRHGVPFLRPHGVLLYKAKAPRPKDEADFVACLPRLSDAARAWLQQSLQRVNPRHPWIERLR